MNPSAGRRTPGGIATDSRILEAAVEELTRVGIDQLTMVGVARQAGLTTGALYARYESIEELVVQVLDDVIAPVLIDYLDTALEDARAGRMARTAGTLMAQDPRLLLAAEYLIVAARDPSLAEVVQPILTGWCERAGGTLGVYDTPSMALLVLVATVLGPLTIALTGDLPDLDWSQGLAAFAAPTFRADAPAARGPVAPVDIPYGIPRTGDDLRDALIASAVEVVAQVGYARATVSRLARRSPYSTQAVYLRYPTKTDLFVDVVDVAVSDLMAAIGEANMEAFASPDPVGGLAAVAVRHVSPEWRMWRRLRLETQLAARYEEGLSNVFRSHHERSSKDWTDGARDLLGSAEALLEVVPWASRGVTLGTYLLEPHLPGLVDADWRVPAQAFVHGLTQRLTAKTPPPTGPS